METKTPSTPPVTPTPEALASAVQHLVQGMRELTIATQMCRAITKVDGVRRAKLHLLLAEVALVGAPLHTADQIDSRQLSLAMGSDDIDADDGYPPPCSNPQGHAWNFDEGTDRTYCAYCGADGDA